MSRDHIVEFRSEESIAEIAWELRRRSGIDRDYYFDINQLIQDYLIPRFTAKGEISLRITEDTSPKHPAWVTFEPRDQGQTRQLMLNIKRREWEDANGGDGRSRFILAHEIGHILLHDYIESHFTSTTIRILKTHMEEQSAEWQANTFAKHLLIPDEIVFELRHLDSIRFNCGVDEEIAKERLERVKRKFWYVWEEHEGCPCRHCGNSLAARANRLVCGVCGYASE